MATGMQYLVLIFIILVALILYLRSKKEYDLSDEDKVQDFIDTLQQAYDKPPIYEGDSGYRITLGNILANYLAVPISFFYSGRLRRIILLKIIGEDLDNIRESDCVYILGWCATKREPRTFKVDRIEGGVTALKTGEVFDDPETFFTRIVFEQRDENLQIGIQSRQEIKLTNPPNIIISYQDDSSDHPESFTITPYRVDVMNDKQRIRAKTKRHRSERKRAWSGEKTFIPEFIHQIEGTEFQEVNNLADWLIQHHGDTIPNAGFYPSLQLDGIKNAEGHDIASALNYLSQ